MNILFLISFAGAGGTEKYVRLLMENYRAQGHCCFLVYSQCGPLSIWAEENGFATWQLDMSRNRIFYAGRKLAKFCRENTVEVIHAQYPRENLIALQAKKRCGIPVVFTGHLTIHQGLRWKLLNRIFTPKDDAVIAVCQAVKQTMLRNGVCPEQIAVIPNGTEIPSLTRSRPEEESVRFITLARFAPEKGLGVLVEACHILHGRSSVPFRCFIYGTGELFDSVQRQIEETGLSDVLFCPGATARPLNELAESDVFVSPSLNNEALSFAALEAMSLGLPLIMTDVGAGSELTADCGILVPPGDAVALSEAMQKLLESRELRTEYGVRAKHRAKGEYSLSSMLTGTMDVYKLACK